MKKIFKQVAQIVLQKKQKNNKSQVKKYKYNPALDPFRYGVGC